VPEDLENRSKENLTEDASPYRIEKYRKKGIVAQSRELNSIIGLLSVGISLLILSHLKFFHFLQFMQEIFQTDFSLLKNLSSESVLKNALQQAFFLSIRIILIVFSFGFFFCILGSLLQVGPIFSWERIQPNFEKLNPFFGAKQLFSKKQFLDGLKLFFKLGVLIFIFFLPFSPICRDADPPPPPSHSQYHLFATSHQPLLE